jgi:serine protease Do
LAGSRPVAGIRGVGDFNRNACFESFWSRREPKMGVVLRDLADWARRRKIFAALLLALTLGLGILIGSVVSGRVAANHTPLVGDVNLLPIPSPVRMSSTFSEIVNRVEPAVVNISTTQVIAPRRNSGRGGNGSPDDPLGGFFNRFFNNPDQPHAERSLGSGIALDPRGYILTNQHVINGATKIEVTLDGDPNRYTARVVGQDGETDLAVIKIDAGRPLRVARLGNSDGVQVGDWVLAFGSPFMLSGTVTAGIVSAKDRNDVSDKQLQHFIQTDAAINPGNSGGPLVDMAGEVIGINTAILTGGESFEGVGFALPSNTAINVYNQLVSQGRVVRGSIGVQFSDQPSTNPIALRELGAPYGVILESVVPGSPAAKAGLEPGDVVDSVNGNPVRKGADMVNPILRTPIGQSVQIGYVRNSKGYKVPVVVADRDKLFPQLADNEGSSASPAPATAPVSNTLGLTVDDLTPGLASRLGLAGNLRGVIVREVAPASFADDAGFQAGDLIVAVNRTPVYTVSEFQRLVSKIQPGQDVMFKVVRQDEGQSLMLFPSGVVPGGK